MAAPQATVPSMADARRAQALGMTFGALGAACMFVAFFSLQSRAWQPVALGVAGLIGFGIASAVYLTKARAALDAFWTAFAKHHGWQCTPLDSSDRPARFRGFRPFGQGSRRRALHVLSGSWRGMAFEAFTYQWTVSSGKSSHTYHAQVVALPMPAHLELSVSPENLGHKIFDALGGEDLDTESDEFSRMFWVRCDDRRLAYDVLNTGMMDHLLRIGPVGTWQWRGPWMLRVLQGKLEPQRVIPLLSEVHGFLANLPRHLAPAAHLAAHRSPAARGPRSEADR